jgi:glutamate carboxypeptidase
MITPELADSFRARIDATREKWLGLLEELVNIECGSEMIDGVVEATGVVADELRSLGLTTETAGGGGEFAPHLVARNSVDGAPIVLGGHLDTTYTDYSNLPKFRIEGERALGPGVSDMKGGVVAYLAALDCLKQAGLLNACPIVVMLNSDEERGAPTSRDMFKECAKTARAALFSECCGPNGEMVTGRRAKLSYRIDVSGVAMHAGEFVGPKSSALIAVSHKIIELEALNEQFEGASFNVGRAWGGIASNTVAADACALLDVRYPLSEQEGAIRDAVEAIVAEEHAPGCTAEATLTSFRPAWLEDGTNRELLKLVEAVGSKLGQTVVGRPQPGTADSNWFGSVGVPTLDGLGPAGFEEHTPKEYIHLETLFERALLLAGVLAVMGEGSCRS